jgi:hypothetical protein
MGNNLFDFVSRKYKTDETNETKFLVNYLNCIYL